MDWIRVCIYTSTLAIDMLSSRLYDINITQIQIDDENDFNEFLEENQKYWDYVDEQLVKKMRDETKITFYLENDKMLSAKINEVKQMLEDIKQTDLSGQYGRLLIETDGISEQDWANNWKEFFKPIEVGNKILIQPEWEKYNGETDRIVFTVNPGLTFGTGTHNSTKLCIAELEKVVTPATAMLDIGCGSGILSIISLLLGADNATALDIDPNSVHVAHENAKMNNVDSPKYVVYSGDILTDKALFEKIKIKKYDVIAANIVADVIIALLPTVKALINKNGTFICSGIIHERLSDVTNAMKNRKIAIADINKDGEWASITCKF